MSYRILVPLDGSSLAEGAIAVAADVATRMKGSVHLVRVHVPIVPIVPAAPLGEFGAPLYDPKWDREAREAAEQYVHAVHRRAIGMTAQPVTMELCDGADPAHEIEEAASRHDAHLILMTTHGMGGAALAWLGSVADAVVRSSRRLVLVLPERAAGRPLIVPSVMVPLDGTTSSMSMVHAASEFARAFGARLALVRVVAPPFIGDVLTVLSAEELDRFGIDKIAELAKHELDAVATAQRAHGVDTTATVIVHARPARALLEHIEKENPGIVAMATSGRGLSRVFVSSTADKILRSAERATLLRHPPETSGA